MFCIFDTETNGLPVSLRYKEYPSPFNLTAYENCRIVQLSYQIYKDKELVIEKDMLIFPDKFTISPESTKIHNISHEEAVAKGRPIRECLLEFLKDTSMFEGIKLIGHNVLFDINAVASELYRLGLETESKIVVGMPRICTMESNKFVLKKEMTLKSGKRIIKDPSLKEVYEFYCKAPIENQHNSLHDVRNTAKVFWAMKYIY